MEDEEFPYTRVNKVVQCSLSEVMLKSTQCGTLQPVSQV